MRESTLVDSVPRSQHFSQTQLYDKARAELKHRYGSQRGVIDGATYTESGCMKKDNWVGPINGVWLPRTCANIAEFQSSSVNQCKTSCLAAEGCTAINYRTKDNWCDLVRCHLPVPSPTNPLEGWKGYYIATDI